MLTVSLAPPKGVARSTAPRRWRFPRRDAHGLIRKPGRFLLVDRKYQGRAAVDGEADLVVRVSPGVDDDRLHVVVQIERVRRMERTVAGAHALLAVDVDRKWHRGPSLSTLPDVGVRS